MLEGIDVSAYQGNVDWFQARRSGKSFGFCKATEGLTYIDPQLASNWHKMGDSSVVRGAYHYFHPSASADGQADYFHAAVSSAGGFRGGDFAIIDLEQDDNVQPEFVIQVAALFIERVREQTGRNCLLYTYPDFWLRILGDPVDPILARSPLWLADYGPSVPHLRNWPKGLSFWQYSDSGHCPGVEGVVDLNRFYGDRRQLHALAHA